MTRRDALNVLDRCVGSCSINRGSHVNIKATEEHSEPRESLQR